MIDYENQIFTAVATALKASYPNITVESIENYGPASFPHVSLVEIKNMCVVGTQDSSSNENHAEIDYELNVTVNNRGGRKREAKAIAACADEVMMRLGFTRITASPISFDEATKYRIVIRYTAVISKDGVIYRR